MIDRFEEFLSRFKKTDIWRNMQLTREGSPWHREENVSVHTEMLLKWYKDNLYLSRTDSQRMLTMISCLMHDIGKPPSQIIKFSEERGEYRAYHGHELVSARMWVDYALTNFAMISELLKIDANDVGNIAFFIEHHVPFSMKNPRKRKVLKDSLIARAGEHGHEAYLDFLLSDQHGRISDDQHLKLAAVDDWMKEWKKI
jgi:hypothetical protein